MMVRFALRALAYLEDIRAYLLPRSPQGAERVRRAIAEAADRCGHDPRRGTKTDEPGLYRWPLRKYRYTIFYRPLTTDDGIEVARVIHGARVKNLRKMPEDE